MDVMSLVARITLDTTDFTSQLNNTQNQATSFGSKVGNVISTGLKVAGAAVVAGTTAMVAFGKSAIDAGMSFDSAMANVKAISGASAEQFEQLRAKAIEMGAQTKYSATEAADAMSYMAMAGWKTEDMLDGIAGIMNLAAASGEDLARTSDIVTDALTAFGLSASDSGHFADVLAAASSNANTNVGMMGETFKYVGSVAGSLGITAEDTALAIGIMANSGIKASQAGTSLRSIISRLSTDAGASSKSLGALGILTKELGVEFYDTDGKVRDFSDVLDEARVKWQELGDQDSTTFAKKIAGEEGMTAWLALMTASEADVEKLRLSIEDCDGTAAEMADTMNDNLAGSLRMLDSAMETLRINISDALSPTLKGFVDDVRNAVSEIAEQIKNNDFEGAIRSFTDMLQSMLQRITEILPQFVEAAGKIIGALVEGIIQSLPDLIQAAVDIVVYLMEQLTISFDRLDNSGELIVVTIGAAIKSNLPKLATAALNLIKALEEYLIKEIPKLAKTAAELVKNLTQYITNHREEIVNAAVDISSTMAKGLIDSLPLLIQSAGEILTSLLEFIADNLPYFLEAGVELIFSMAEGLIQALPDIANALAEVLYELVSTIIEKLPDFLDQGEEIARNIQEGIANLANELRDTVFGILSDLIDTIVSFFTNFWRSGEDIGENMADGLASSEGEADSAMERILDALQSAISWALSNFFGQGWEIVSQIASGLWSGSGEVDNNIWSIINNITNAFNGQNWWSLGSNVIQGIINGISNGAQSLANTMYNMASNAWNTVTSYFGIYSPSRKMMWAGSMIDEGLSKGIDDNAAGVQQSINELSQMIDDPFSTPPQMATSSASTQKEAAKSAIEGSGQSTNNSYGGVTMNIYGAVGQDVNELAEIIANKLDHGVYKRRAAWGVA